MIGNKVVAKLDSATRVSGGATFVPMMEPAHLGDRNDSPGLWRLDGAKLGRVLLQAEVRAAPMISRNLRRWRYRLASLNMIT